MAVGGKAVLEELDLGRQPLDRRLLFGDDALLLGHGRQQLFHGGDHGLGTGMIQRLDLGASHRNEGQGGGDGKEAAAPLHRNAFPLMQSLCGGFLLPRRLRHQWA